MKKIIVGMMVVVMVFTLTKCKEVKLENLLSTDDKSGFIFSKNGYNFHYLTFIERQTQSGSPYLGKDVSLLTLSTLKRWANQGFGNFNPPQRRYAFVNKIEATIKQIQNGAYNGAENKIANDIIPFMEESVTGPFRNTFGLLLESSLVGIMQAEDTIEIDISYKTILYADPRSLQKIEAIICKPYAFVCELIVPKPNFEDTLQAVSCALAMGLEDRENREILYEYLINSPYKEHKIYLKDYINAIRSDGKEVVSVMSISSGYPVDYLKALTQNHPQIATHFPDSSHYLKWINRYEGMVPWVTYAPPFVSDSEVTSLTGFINTGEKNSISGITPPDYPVLIITYEPPESISPDTVIEGKGRIKEIPEQGTLSDYYKILVRVMHIRKRCEPWWLGDMEIYTAVFHEDIYWSNVVPYYISCKTLKNCPGVTTTDLKEVDKRCISYKIYRTQGNFYTCPKPDKRGKPAVENFIGGWELYKYDMVVLEQDYAWCGFVIDEDDWLGRISIVDVWNPYLQDCPYPGDRWCNPAPCLPLRSEPNNAYDAKVYYYYKWEP